MEKVKYITKIERVPELSANERLDLMKVTEKFAFRTNSYYQSLINWDDPADPIRRIIIPSMDELEVWGALDASNEHLYKKTAGLEHKYEFTALLLVNDVCAGYCRFCFRKRLFMDINDEVTRDISAGLEYIRKNPEINNVLLTGGDPLLLSTRKLGAILEQLRQIDHVKIIRIGSKIPAFNPFRILNDSDLLKMFEMYSEDHRKIYLMTHFNHPRELTEEAIWALNLLQKAGVVATNQTPLLRGVNDDPDTLGELFNQLSYIGVPPYYVFICRPTAGNKMFAVPVEDAFEIFEQARMNGSGLAKRAKLVMSHSTGKIEVVGKTDDQVFFRYHRAANPEQKAKFLVFGSNPDAYWFDDYDEFLEDYSIPNPSCQELFE